MTDKEFWGKCGLVEQQTGSWYEDKVGGEFVCAEMPPSTGIKALGFLFKYAVPKVERHFHGDSDSFAFFHFLCHWCANVSVGEDPAIALRKPIEEIL